MYQSALLLISNKEVLTKFLYKAKTNKTNRKTQKNISNSFSHDPLLIAPPIERLILYLNMEVIGSVEAVQCHFHRRHKAIWENDDEATCEAVCKCWHTEMPSWTAHLHKGTKTSFNLFKKCRKLCRNITGVTLISGYYKYILGKYKDWQWWTS